MCLPFRHKWEKIGEEIVKTYAHEFPEGYPIKIVKVYLLQCTKCGWLRSRKVRL